MVRDRFYEGYLGFVETVVVDPERFNSVLMYRSENVDTVMAVNVLRSLVQFVLAALQFHLVGLQWLSGGI